MSSSLLDKLPSATAVIYRTSLLWFSTTGPFNASHVPITLAENTAKQITNMQKPIMITRMLFLPPREKRNQ